MEDSELADKNVRPKIATLVFMDLESTGLPCYIGRRNVHITEMSLIAVDRNSFQTDKNLRVLNKISLCVRPRTTISPGSMDITGLHNDILESQLEFDDSVPKLMEYFFRRLQKPICLLAHNGNNFDFPVLQAELSRLNYALGSDIVCADTLEAFRFICNSRKQAVALEAEQKLACEKKQFEKQNTFRGNQISDDDIDNILSEDLECFSNIDNDFLPENSDVMKPVDNRTENNCIVQKTYESPSGSVENPVETSVFVCPTLDTQTPQKQKTPSNTNENVRVRKRKTTDTTYTPQLQYKKRTNPIKRNIPAKKTLFHEYDLSSFEIHKITKFSLQNLYYHFFNENPPNSHYAEIDTICLSKVCQKINEDFLKWIDEHYVSFSSINALW